MNATPYDVRRWLKTVIEDEDADNTGAFRTKDFQAFVAARNKVKNEGTKKEYETRMMREQEKEGIKNEERMWVRNEEIDVQADITGAAFRFERDEEKKREMMGKIVEILKIGSAIKSEGRKLRMKINEKKMTEIMKGWDLKLLLQGGLRKVGKGKFEVRYSEVKQSNEDERKKLIEKLEKNMK